MSRHRAFTLLELVAAMVVALLSVACLSLPYCSRRCTHPISNDSRVRGIHQSLVTYASGNNDFYPGLDSAGNVIDASVEGRYKILLDSAYFTGEYIVSPLDKSMKPWQPGQPLTSANYSYAMLQIATPGCRRNEWADTINTEAPVVSDRNTGTSGNPASYASIHSKKGWQGSVAWNDNHVTFEKSPVLATAFSSRPASQTGGQSLAAPQSGAVGTDPAPPVRHAQDDLFAAAGPDDAYMIHAGK